VAEKILNIKLNLKNQLPPRQILHQPISTDLNGFRENSICATDAPIRDSQGISSKSCPQQPLEKPEKIRTGKKRKLLGIPVVLVVKEMHRAIYWNEEQVSLAKLGDIPEKRFPTTLLEIIFVDLDLAKGL